MKTTEEIVKAIDNYTLKLSFEIAEYSSKNDDMGVLITTGELIALSNLLTFIGQPEEDNKPAKVLKLIEKAFE